MSIRLRYSLGRKLGSNIITDPTFIAACGVNWVCEKDWSIAGNTASFVATGPGDVLRGLRQNGILTRGQRYRVTYDYIAPAAFGAHVMLGDYLVNLPYDTSAVPTSVSVDGTCLSANTDFGIYGNDGAGDYGIQNVYVYPLNWNTPLENEPILNTKIEIQEDGVIESLTMGFLQTITFWGDGYEYFISNYNEKKTPLKIEYNEGDGWTYLSEGEVYFQDRIIDYERKQITLSYQDKSIMNVLNKGRETQVEFLVQGVADWDPRILTGVGAEDVFDLVEMHNPATGAYTDTAFIFRLHHVLMIIVHQISELDIHIDASPLENMSDLGGAATDYLGIFMGANGRNVGIRPQWMYLSFQEVINEFYKLSNIAIVPRIVNGVKTLVIELRDSFITDSGIDFTNVAKIKESKSEFNFRSFLTGFRQSGIDRTNTKVQYYSEFTFYEGNKDLRLEWLQNGTIIWDIINGGNTDYDSDILLVEYFDDGGTWRSQVFAGNAYNADIDEDDNINRFADVMTGDYIRQADGEGSLDVVVGTANYVRTFEFPHPMTITEFLIFLNNPYAYIDITSNYIDLNTNLAINTSGYIISLEYDLIKGMGIFKMLVE